MGVLDGIKAILSPAGAWAWAELGKSAAVVQILNTFFVVNPSPISFSVECPRMTVTDRGLTHSFLKCH